MCEGNGAQELAGTAAVVTGSNRNIGRGIALALADAGAAVVIYAHLSRDLAEGEEVGDVIPGKIATKLQRLGLI